MGINLRPYCKKFIKKLSNYYEIVIFTAADSCYANTILNIIDPESKYITARLFRDSCIMLEEGILIKDLRIIENRDLEDIITVDNSLHCYGFNLDNAIPIIPFFDDKNDTELKNLELFLINLSNSKNLKEIISKFFFYDIFKQNYYQISILMKKLVNNRKRLLEFKWLKKKIKNNKNFNKIKNSSVEEEKEEDFVEDREEEEEENDQEEEEEVDEEVDEEDNQEGEEKDSQLSDFNSNEDLSISRTSIKRKKMIETSESQNSQEEEEEHNQSISKSSSESEYLKQED